MANSESPAAPTTRISEARSVEEAKVGRASRKRRQKIRNPKSEIRKKFKIQVLNVRKASVLPVVDFADLDFEFVLNFDLREPISKLAAQEIKDIKEAKNLSSFSAFLCLLVAIRTFAIPCRLLDFRSPRFCSVRVSASGFMAILSSDGGPIRTGGTAGRKQTSSGCARVDTSKIP